MPHRLPAHPPPPADAAHHPDMAHPADAVHRDPTHPTASPHADTLINALAADQHGVVARRQLLAAGVPAHVVDHRVSTGRIEPLFRGVYRIGPLRSPDEGAMAAVLACGDGAALAYRSAGGLWGLVASRGPGEPTEVVVAGRQRSPGPRVIVHRVRELAPDEVTELRGIPLTSPTRTLVDLARLLPLRDLERALATAARSGLLGPDGIDGILGRYPRRPGTAALRAVAALGPEPALTRSDAETLFLELVRKAGLPAPRLNRKVRGHEVDFNWRDARLIVEIDGFAHHSSRRAFENDRARTAALTAAGYRVVRITWRQLTRSPEAVVASVAQALMHRQAAFDADGAHR